MEKYRHRQRHRLPSLYLLLIKLPTHTHARYRNPPYVGSFGHQTAHPVPSHNCIGRPSQAFVRPGEILPSPTSAAPGHPARWCWSFTSGVRPLASPRSMPRVSQQSPSSREHCLGTSIISSKAARLPCQHVRNPPHSLITPQTLTDSDQLPTLHDSAHNTWTAGYDAIIAYLRTHHTSSVPSLPSSRQSAADAAAYSAFLTTHAAPLLALSLYVSSANWSATVRPAYSLILPFPLPWTEPPAVRAAMSRRAEYLGMSSLDMDAVAEREEAAAAAAAAAGWVQVPKGLIVGGRKAVGQAMAPEQRSRIRLEGLARDVLDVLAEVEWEGQEMSLRCLAWAYLALMVVPSVPRAWLGETVVEKYKGLSAFVWKGRTGWFSQGVEALPWRAEKAEATVTQVGGRFLNQLVGDIPGFGEEWRRWWARRRIRSLAGRAGALDEGSGQLWRWASMGVALAVGVVLWRRLPKFGAPIQTWQRPLPGLLGLGLAGAMLQSAALGGL